MKQKCSLGLCLLLLPAVVLTCFLPMSSAAPEEYDTDVVNHVLKEAEELLEQFQFQAARQYLDESLQRFPHSPELHKKRGDVLMGLRLNDEALLAYRKALDYDPEYLEGYWALWTLLDRLSLHSAEALQILMAIAERDADNPLAQLRVARKLRELGRFEESVRYFQRAVDIAPAHPAYHLYLARAFFDNRESKAALEELEWVLSHTFPHSPVAVAADNLSQTLRGGTVDMGGQSDFFEHTKKPYGEEGKDYKRWALTREHAWQSMKAGKFSEAESLWREVLALDPEDDVAHYHLGLTLFQLERYEEAITSLHASFHKSKQPTFYPDAIFQIGQAFAKLKQWTTAIAYYQHVLDMQDLQEQDFYSLNFPDLPTVEAALREANAHALDTQSSSSMPVIPPPTFQTEGPRKENPAPMPFPRHSQALPPSSRSALSVRPLSVETVRGWFRQLITAKAIMQDNRQAGYHEYIPLDPGDTFTPDQPEIYLVFSLTTPPADAKQIATQWVLEQSEQGFPEAVIGRDTVLVELNDSTGYFVMDQPPGGWPVGTHRIDLFVGEEVSPYTYVADVRFRIQPADGR